MKSSFLIRMVSALVLFSALGLGTAPSAFADFRHVREVRHEEGHWVHDRHGGRLGWWWVVGPAWTYFARPYPAHRTVIIEEQPAVTVVQAAPPSAPAVPVFYYCKATGNYYPDSMTCPQGWSLVSAKTPPDLSGANGHS